MSEVFSTDSGRYESKKKISFRVISECPCGRCVLKTKSVWCKACMECNDSNSWSNFDPLEPEKEMYKVEKEAERKPFSFDDLPDMED
jgi:hypothetical protein